MKSKWAFVSVGESCYFCHSPACILGGLEGQYGKRRYIFMCPKCLKEMRQKERVRPLALYGISEEDVERWGGGADSQYIKLYQDSLDEHAEQLKLFRETTAEVASAIESVRRKELIKIILAGVCSSLISTAIVIGVLLLFA